MRETHHAALLAAHLARTTDLPVRLIAANAAILAQQTRKLARLNKSRNNNTITTQEDIETRDTVGRIKQAAVYITGNTPEIDFTEEYHPVLLLLNNNDLSTKEPWPLGD